MDYGVPIHLIELVHGWHLVVTTRGNKYYYNTQTRESTWTLTDEALQKHLDDMNKEDLILIIAWCRGLKIGKADYEYISGKYFVKSGQVGTMSQVNVSANDVAEELKGIEEEEEEEEISVEETIAKKNSLLMGYDSSSSDDEEDNLEQGLEEEEEEEEVPSNEGEDVTDSSNDEAVDFDLSDLESDLDVDGDPNEFISLLEESHIDPMGSYELQMDKLTNDPRYFSVDNSKKRKQIFDNWSRSKIVIPNDNIEEDTIYDRYPYLEIVDFLNSKYKQLNKKLFLFEFRKKFKDEIRGFDKSEFDKTYKEFVINHFDYTGDVVARFKEKYKGLVVGKKQVEAKDYYGLIREIGLDRESVFMKDAKLQSLSEEAKYELVVSLLQQQ